MQILNTMMSPVPKQPHVSSDATTSRFGATDLSIATTCSPTNSNNRLTNASTNASNHTNTTNLKTKEVAPFLKNLRKMLDCESDDILRWTTNGKAFEIHDMEKMMSYVLPKYFKHRKYTSFQRQLNYFNFRKWTKSKAVVCTFSNEFFLRDQPELSWRITRKKSMSPSNAAKNVAVAAANQMKIVSPKPVASAADDSTSVMAMHPPLQQRQQHQHTPTAASSESMWKKPDHESANIMVPAIKHESFASEPYPSPTEMDVMLYEHDHMTNHSSTFCNGSHGLIPAGGSSYEHELDSLDWIDSLLPLDINGRMDEPAYNHFESEATLRSTANGSAVYGGGYAMHPSSGFGCMASAL